MFLVFFKWESSVKWWSWWAVDHLNQEFQHRKWTHAGQRICSFCSHWEFCCMMSQLASEHHWDNQREWATRRYFKLFGKLNTQHENICNLDNKTMLLRQNVPYVRKFFTISEISIVTSIYVVTRPSLNWWRILKTETQVRVVKKWSKSPFCRLSVDITFAVVLLFCSHWDYKALSPNDTYSPNL